jgi:hypothetical protein
VAISRGEKAGFDLAHLVRIHAPAAGAERAGDVCDFNGLAPTDRRHSDSRHSDSQRKALTCNADRGIAPLIADQPDASSHRPKSLAGGYPRFRAAASPRPSVAVLLDRAGSSDRIGAERNLARSGGGSGEWTR